MSRRAESLHSRARGGRCTAVGLCISRRKGAAASPFHAPDGHTAGMRFVKESVIDASVEEVFAFHERPDAFARLQPPWEHAQIIEPPVSLAVGTVVRVRTRVGPLWVTIVAEHVGYEKNRSFEDVMTRGPFASWHHKHLFIPEGARCLLRDEVDFEPPFGPLGRLVAPLAVLPRLKRMFDYRHEVTRREVLAARGTR
jgi:ligand-binding SRPBCC domain-containing protein